VSTKVPWPQMHAIKGVRIGAASAGIKRPGRLDVLVFEVAEGATVSGVFTQNAFCAAPVLVAKDHLVRGEVRYLLINSGNANACTGDRGLADARATCEAVAAHGGVAATQVLPFSTGVIGEFLPVEKISNAVPEAIAALNADAWEQAARAIMTTDTCPKGASVQFEFESKTVSVTGVAKGAGMIRPNMATMLAYVATDAAVAQPVLDDLVRWSADRSFNRITIDGDTSTNDSCVLMASGQAGVPRIEKAEGELFERLRDALVAVMQQLAHAIVRDGEGATKFVTIEVSGGADSAECLRAAYSIAHSPLVKTALYASDANWGRIVAAVGYAGIANLDVSKIKVCLDDVLVVDGGARHPGYTDEAGTAIVKRPEFAIKVHLGRGEARETVWTSDLSHDYVTINAEYRT
jgi:glutamate N-acetyltransferase/amino-acid acetyltransferase